MTTTAEDEEFANDFENEDEVDEGAADTDPEGDDGAEDEASPEAAATQKTKPKSPPTPPAKPPQQTAKATAKPPAATQGKWGHRFTTRKTSSTSRSSAATEPIPRVTKLSGSAGKDDLMAAVRGVRAVRRHSTSGTAAAATSSPKLSAPPRAVGGPSADAIVAKFRSRDELAMREQHIKQLQEEIRTLKKVQRLQDRALRQSETDSQVARVERLMEEQRVLAEELKLQNSKRRDLEEALRDARSRAARLEEECGRLRDSETPERQEQRKMAEEKMPELERAKLELEHKVDVMSKIKDQDDIRIQKLARENKRLKDQVASIEEELRESQARLAAANAAVGRKQKIAAGVAGTPSPDATLAPTSTVTTQQSPQVPQRRGGAFAAAAPPPMKLTTSKKKATKPEELPSPVNPETPPPGTTDGKPPSPGEVAVRLQQELAVQPKKAAPRDSADTTGAQLPPQAKKEARNVAKVQPPTPPAEEQETEPEFKLEVSATGNKEPETKKQPASPFSFPKAQPKTVMPPPPPTQPPQQQEIAPAISLTPQPAKFEPLPFPMFGGAPLPPKPGAGPTTTAAVPTPQPQSLPQEGSKPKSTFSFSFPSAPKQGETAAASPSNPSVSLSSVLPPSSAIAPATKSVAPPPKGPASWLGGGGERAKKVDRSSDDIFDL